MDRVFDGDFYAKLNTLRMSIRLRMAAGMNGGRKSNAKGSSVEFSDFREYILGDDIRRIDWNAYGRFDRLYVKLFMEEKEGLFNLFLDASQSMNFGANNKAHCAQRIAGALSYVVLENSDRLFLNIMKNGGLISEKGLTGRQSFSRALEFLENADFSGEGNLLASLQKRSLKQRGISVIISDLYTEQLESMLKYLQFKKQEVIVIQVVAPEEEHPSFEGTVNLLDSETADGMRMTMSNALIREYTKRYNAFLHRTDALCKKYSAIYVRVNSADSLDSIFFGTLTKIAGR